MRSSSTAQLKNLVVFHLILQKKTNISQTTTIKQHNNLSKIKNSLQSVIVALALTDGKNRERLAETGLDWTIIETINVDYITGGELWCFFKVLCLLDVPKFMLDAR